MPRLDKNAVVRKIRERSSLKVKNNRKCILIGVLLGVLLTVALQTAIGLLSQEFNNNFGDLWVITFQTDDEVRLIKGMGGAYVHVGYFRRIDEPGALLGRDLGFTSTPAGRDFGEFHQNELCYHPGLGFPACGGGEGAHGVVRVFYRDWHEFPHDLVGTDPQFFDPIIGIAEDNQWLWQDEEYLPNAHPFLLTLMAKSENRLTPAQTMDELVNEAIKLWTLFVWTLFFRALTFVTIHLPL